MNMKKIICLGMSVAMAAALAVPACAADAVNEDYGNTTDIVLKYAPSDTPYDDYDPEADGAFTITIPSKIDLTATDDGEDGVIITGDGVIKFKGMIGQNDKVNLSVKSTNNYRLVDEATGDFVACYTMTASTENNDCIDILKDTYDTTPSSADLFAARDIMDSTGKDPGYAMSDNYAKAFQSEATIDLTFDNNGPNNIFGKGEYTDTLTFDYQYNTYKDGKYTASGSTSLNINNGVDGSQTSDKDNGIKGYTVTGDVKDITLNGTVNDITVGVDGWKDGYVLATSINDGNTWNLRTECIYDISKSDGKTYKFNIMDTYFDRGVDILVGYMTRNDYELGNNHITTIGTFNIDEI